MVAHSKADRAWTQMTEAWEARLMQDIGVEGFAPGKKPKTTINGLFTAEVIFRRGPWRSFEAVEYATLVWVDWFDNHRLLEPIEQIPPAEAEANDYDALQRPNMAAQLRQISLRQTRRGSQVARRRSYFG